MRTITLDEHIRTAIEGALRVAAEKYEDNATICRTESEQVWHGVADRFTLQAKEARAIADDLEVAEWIQVRPAGDESFAFIGGGEE